MPLIPILALVTAIGLAAPLPGGTFTDDDGSVHEGGIEAIAADGITFGCNPPFNDRFCPDRVLSRAEMAAMISRALDLPDATQDYFVDDNGHGLENAINKVAQARITLGCNPPANDRFCPNQKLTRAQAAGFLSRALDLADSKINHFLDDDGHVLEPAINRIADANITRGCNPPTNTNYCPNDGLTRAQMATMLTRALDHLTAMVPPPRPPLGWEVLASGFSSPIQALALPGEDRLLIAEQGGLVKVWDDGLVSGTPFLDISDDVVFSGERGLLSIAVHPDYPADRRMFAWYYGSGNRTYLVEYDIAANLETASSPRTVLSVSQPYTNHNGGFIDFGPDGYLYLGLGDGGSGNDPGGNARDLSTLLGKMIRIDVDGANPYEIPADNPYVGVSGRDEIWASGLRNPWRWSFDGENLFIGDVGQSAREEINAVAVSPVGYDFGWSRYEASLCNPADTDPSCSTAGLTFPVHEYGRSVGRSVTGGVVYRGPTVRSLDAFYIWADVFSGTVQGFRLLDGAAVEKTDFSADLGLGGIVSIATDSGGELLAVSLFTGSVYRLTGG